jgi:hypothetical protein
MTRTAWLPAWFLLLLTSAARADRAPIISDRAGLFDKATIEKATAEIKRIREVYKRDFVVETVKSLPLPEGERPMIWFFQKQRAREQQARQRAEELHVDGIFLLIVKDPPAVTVIGWPEKHTRVFSDVDAVALRYIVSSRLKNRDPDQALLDAVKEVAARLHYNGADKDDPERTSSDVLLLSSLGVLIVLAGVVVILRRRLAPPQVPTEEKPALLASMYGAAASHWVSDRLFLRSPAPAAAGGPVATAATANPPANP